MEQTTLAGTAPLTRRQAREIERRTGVRPLAGAPATAFVENTDKIERNEMDALISVFPTELVERISAPIADEAVEIPAAFDARGLTVRANRPAALVAQRRRRVAGGFAAAASVTALAAAGLSTVAGQGADVAAESHQANLLTATTADTADLPEETEAEAEVAAAPQAIQVDAETTSVQTFDAAVVQTAATEVVVETPAEEVTETESTGSSNSGTSSSSSGASASTASYEAPAPTGTGIVDTAYSWVGKGIYGNGNTPSGWDCAGFVQYVYAQNGISVPRSVSGQDAAGVRVSDPQPGDLVIWPGQHVGIYVGNGMMIDSPNWGRSIELDTVANGPSSSGYYFVRL